MLETWGAIYADLQKVVLLTNIERRTWLSNERVYSPIPLKLLVGENIYCLINTNPNNSSGFEHEWGFLPWLRDMPSKLSDLIYDNETIKRYSSLDDLNMKFKHMERCQANRKHIDSVTNSELIQLRNLLEYATNNRTNNHFYIHILGVHCAMIFMLLKKQRETHGIYLKNCPLTVRSSKRTILNLKVETSFLLNSK